jgi:outer membrane biosynthesis protein TonB
MISSDYVWSGENGLEVHMSLDVVNRLGAAALEGLKSLPRRGLEVGGLLLGRSEANSGTAAICINDFFPVCSEHCRGPFYQLSEADTNQVDAAVAAHPDITGIFRTHTRSEVLIVDEEDAKHFQRYFSSALGIFLLVHPATGRAAYFLPAEGKLQCAHEFGFRVSEIGDLVESRSTPLQPHSAAIVSDPVNPRRAALPAARAVNPQVGFSSKPESARGLWALGAAGLLAAGILLLAAWLYYSRSGRNRDLAMAPRAAAIASAPVAELPVNLSVARNGEGLRLTWEQKSRPIQLATMGILTIFDGAHNIRLNLDALELKSGAVFYLPETQNISFRLEILGPAGTTEWTRVIGGSPAAPKVTWRSVPPKPVKAKSAGPKPKLAQVEVASHQDRPRLEPSPFEMPALPPAPMLIETPPPPPIGLHVSAEGEQRHEVAPSVSVTAQPVVDGRFGRVVGKVPLLRRFGKSAQAFVPPKPVSEVQPTLRPEERRSVTQNLRLDVKVYIDESGMVQYAELLTPASEKTRNLAAAAVYTARRWRFTPARSGERAIPSEFLLRFDFKPE